MGNHFKYICNTVIMLLLLLLLLLLSVLDLYSQSAISFDSIVKFRYDRNITSPENMRRINKQLDRFINFRSSRLYDNGKYPNIADLYYKFHNNFNKNNEKLQSINWEELGPKKIEPRDVNAGNGRVNSIAFNPLKKNEIWVGAASGGLWKSENNGKSWKPIDMTQFMSIGISDIKFSSKNPNVVYAATGDADGGMYSGTFSVGIIKSIDNGLSWKITNFHNFSDGLLIFEMVIDPNNENVVWAATGNGIIRTNDGGVNWFYEVTGNCFSTLKMHPENPEILYAGTAYWGGKTKLIRTTDSGKNWNEIAEFDTINRLTISVNKKYPNNLYVIGSLVFKSNLGLCMISYNKGENWDAWNAATLKRNDAILGQGFYNLVLFSDYKSDSSMFIGGIYLGYYDSKSKEILFQTGPHVDYHCFVYNEFDSNYYCGNDGGIYRTKDPYTSVWENISAGLGIMQVYRATPNPFHINNMMAGSQDNGIVEFKDSLWKNILVADGMECVYDSFLPSLNYKSGQNGYIIQNNSTKILVKINSINETKPWTTHYIAHPNISGQILFAFQNLYLYDINTDSLSKLSNFADNNTISYFEIANSNTDTIYIIRGYDIYKTTNGGLNWNLYFKSEVKISSLTINPENSEIIYVTFSGYDSEKKVFEIQNEQIRNITFNLMNIPVNKIIIPKTNPDVLIIATDLGVFSKYSDESEWSIFGNGLPNVIINDLKIHYGNGYIYAGTWGRGVWRAKLWNCENQKILIDAPDTLAFICIDDSLVVKVLNPEKDMIYLWSNGEIGTRIVIKNTGDYYVSANNEYGCVSSSKYFSVNSNSFNFKVFVDSHSKFCKGDTAVLFVDVYKYKPIKYYWSNGDTTQSIKITEDGDYYCTVEFENGCQITSKNFLVNFNQKPSKPSIGFNDKTNELFLINSTPPIDIASILWFKNGKKIETDSIDHHFIKIDSSDIYSVKVYDKNYCNSSSGEIVVILSEDFPIPISINTIAINGEYYFNTLLPENSELIIEIYELKGKLLTKYSNEKQFGYINIKFNLNEFSSSIYYLKLKYNNRHIKTIKLVK